MIKTENLTINGKAFIHTYSDSGMKVHGGSPVSDYDDAVDLAELGLNYVETNIPVDSVEADAEEIVSILTGESA